MMTPSIKRYYSQLTCYLKIQCLFFNASKDSGDVGTDPAAFVNASLGAVTGTAVNVNVVASESSKFVLTKDSDNLVITLQDEYGNTNY